ncbi:hypothetical protein TWF103_012007 [Orbilia oligospora]|nr:hypothetical protein TWF103_012007 [Orbilia oligospora]
MALDGVPGYLPSSYVCPGCQLGVPLLGKAFVYSTRRQRTPPLWLAALALDIITNLHSTSTNSLIDSLIGLTEALLSICFSLRHQLLYFSFFFFFFFLESLPARLWLQRFSVCFLY